MNTQLDRPVLSTFEYQGHLVSFSKFDNVMINATEMAKVFDKEPKFWLLNKSTSEFLNELGKVRNLTLDKLVVVTKGGVNSGTWMQEDVAIEFARWLSPAFAIWCNDRIKELGKYGLTATPERLEELINNPDLLIKIATELKNERAERERISKVNESLNATIQHQAPRVLFARAVETSQRSILIGELAKILKQNGIEIGQNRLFTELRNTGYLCRKGDYYNTPTQQAMELGLFEIKKTSITKPDGTTLVTTTTKVTGKGQIYFVNKFLKRKQHQTA